MKRLLAGAWLLLAGSCAVACGTRSGSEPASCEKPEDFPKADGAPSGCKVVKLVACKTTQGAVVLCDDDASNCGTPVDAGSCTNACSEIAYALECPEHGTFLGNPPGAPAGCIALSSTSATALACCPCLDQ
jgi:hypothetical protein